MVAWYSIAPHPYFILFCFFHALGKYFTEQIRLYFTDRNWTELERGKGSDFRKKDEIPI